MNPDINRSFLLQVCDPEEEVCNWLENNVDENNPTHKMSAEMLRSWMAEGARTMLGSPEHDVTLEEYRFSSKLYKEAEHFDVGEEASILRSSQNGRHILRCLYNPFEEIGSSCFRSRATVKAANLDWIFKFTEPFDQQGNPLVNDDKQGLCYSDIFGDDDSFVEYIEWRKRKQNKSTTKLDISSICENGKLDDAFMISNPLYMDKFIEYVRGSDVGARLHLLSIDGYKQGIHFCLPDGARVNSEMFLKHSTLSYCILALSLLRHNGTFIVKIYSSMELFTVGLLYLMYRCFDKITIIKPVSCRPDHSTEAYLMCKWKKPVDQTEIVRQYLCEINMKMNDMKDTSLDVMQLVPFEVLKADEKFFDFICDRNDRALQKKLLWYQCVQQNGLKNGLNDKFYDPRKFDFKKRCCQLWDIPEIANNRIWKLKSSVDKRNKKEGATNNRNAAKNVHGAAHSSNYKFENWRRKEDDHHNHAATVKKVQKFENWRKPYE